MERANQTPLMTYSICSVSCAECIFQIQVDHRKHDLSRKLIEYQTHDGNKNSSSPTTFLKMIKDVFCCSWHP